MPPNATWNKISWNYQTLSNLKCLKLVAMNMSDVLRHKYWELDMKILQYLGKKAWLYLYIF